MTYVERLFKAANIEEQNAQRREIKQKMSLLLKERQKDKKTERQNDRKTKRQKYF